MLYAGQGNFLFQVSPSPHSQNKQTNKQTKQQQQQQPFTYGKKNALKRPIRSGRKHAQHTPVAMGRKLNTYLSLTKKHNQHTYPLVDKIFIHGTNTLNKPIHLFVQGKNLSRPCQTGNSLRILHFICNFVPHLFFVQGFHQVPASDTLQEPLHCINSYPVQEHD